MDLGGCLFKENDFLKVTAFNWLYVYGGLVAWCGSAVVLS